jgi:hypothetical protein
MGLFGGLFNAAGAKASRIGLKMRQMAGKIGRVETRERQQLKNAAIKELDAANLSRDKMEIIGRLIPYVRRESGEIQNAQRLIQSETSILNNEINLMRGLNFFQPNGISAQQANYMKQVLLRNRQFESEEQALSLRAAQQAEGLVRNLRTQRQLLTKLMTDTNRQIKDLQIEEKMEKKVGKEEAVEAKIGAGMTWLEKAAGGP